MRMTIGERLKERRKELHMTLEDVSKATGMPRSTIQRWESGAVINMGLSNLQKVANALNTTVSYLQTGVSVTVDYGKRREISNFDVFEYLCKKTGYSYASRVGTTRYYCKAGSEFAPADEKNMKEVLEQTAHYFAFLMHERSETLEEFMAHPNRV